MADRADGSIRINTKLDTEGFEKGSGRLQDALRSFRDMILSVSGQLSGAFGLAQLRSNMQDAARSTQEFRDDVEDVAQTMAAVDMADTFIQAQDVLDTLSRKIAEVRDRTYQLEDGTTALGSQTEQYRAMVDAYDQLRTAVDSVDESQKSMVGNYQDMTYFAAKFQETENSMDSALTYEQTADAVAELRRQMEAFGEMDFTIGGKLLKGADTAGFQQMKADVEAAEQKLEEMAHSPAWNEMMQKWQQMPTVSGMVKNTFASAFSAIVSKAIQAGAAVHTAVHNPLQALDRMGAAAGSAAVKLGKIGAGPAVAGLKIIAEGAKKAAMNLAEMAKNAAIAPFKKLGNALSGVFSRNKAMNGGFKQTLTTMLKYGLGIRSLYFLFNKLRTALMDGFKNLMQYDSGLAGTVNSFKASLETLKNSFAAAFAPIAQVVLPILTRMINALSQAISYVGMFIAALTGQKTFKRAVAQQSAAADAADAAADAYGNEAKAAKKAQKTVASFDELHILDDKSDSGSTGAGTPGSGGAAFEDVPVDSKIDDLVKKLKEMWDLADFTELGRRLGEGLKNLLDSIPWDKIKEVARKLGKSIATFLNGFLEVPGLFYTIGKTIAEGINTIFELLNAFVNNFHFDSLGYAIKDAILGLLDNLDWPLIYDTFAKAGIGLGQAIEAAFDNPEIWTAVFEGLSHRWEALLLFIDGLISTPDWASIARNIGTGMNAGVEAFPWNLLAKTLSDALNMVFDIAYNWLTTFDFRSFGSHIGKALTDAVAGVNWAEGGAAIGAAINALYDVINGFIEDMDWRLLGKSVIDFIGGYFAELDVGKWGEFAGNVLTALFDYLSGAVQEVDWAAVPGQIVGFFWDFFDGVNWGEVAGSAMSLLGSALGAAFEFCVGVLAGVGGAVYEGFKYVIDGGLQGIVDALANIGGWIVDHIFQPFIDGFKAAFGIASPSKEMETVGGYVSEGLLGGILAPLKNIAGWLSEHVGGPIINGVKTLFGIGGKTALEDPGSSVTEGLKKGMGGAISGISSWIKGNVTDPVKSAVEDNLGTNGTAVTNADGEKLVEGLKSGMGAEASGIDGYVGENVAAPIASGMESALGISGGGESSKFAAYGKGVVAGLNSGISSGASAVVKTVSGLAKTMLGAFSNVDWKKLGTTVISGIQKGISGGVKATLAVMSDLAKNLPTFIKNVDWKALGNTVIEGVKNGISNGVSAALSVMRNLASTLPTFIRNVDWKGLGGGVSSGIQNGISSGVSAVLSVMRGLASSLPPFIRNVDWRGLGGNVASGIQNGISSGAYSVCSTMRSLGSSLLNSFSGISWSSIGQNICTGIYNGLMWGWSWLTNTAWNLAVNIFNAAKRALGISSPSKEFYWMGQMLTEGMANGIDDTQDAAVSSVEALAQAVVDEAENAKPKVTIDAAADGIDGVLTGFADKVTDGFAAMISRMEEIAAGSSFYVPAAAAGAVVPYSARDGGIGGAGTRFDDVADMLERAGSRQVTRRDIEEVVESALSRYLNIQFYIGDEQVARAANAGNMRINRRYSTSEG